MTQIHLQAAVDKAIQDNLQGALQPMGFGDMGHAKRLDFLARLMGFRNHEHRLTLFPSDNSAATTVRVSMKCVIDESQRHPVDQEELPRNLVEDYEIALTIDDPIEEALDRFHDSWAIKVLDDYEISATLIQGPADLIAGPPLLKAWVPSMDTPTASVEPCPPELDSMEALKQRYSEGCHPIYGVDDWAYEVANGDDQRGYWEWVAHCIEVAQDQQYDRDYIGGTKVGDWVEVGEQSKPVRWEVVAMNGRELQVKEVGHPRFESLSPQAIDISIVSRRIAPAERRDAD